MQLGLQSGSVGGAALSLTGQEGVAILVPTMPVYEGPRDSPFAGCTICPWGSSQSLQFFQAPAQV